MNENLFERIRNAPPLDRKALIAKYMSARTRLFEMEILVLQNRYGGLSPREEEARRSIFNAETEAQILLCERFTLVHEWKEPLPGGGVMNWRMEEKENGDQEYSMSVDIRIAIMPVSPGDSNAEPYVYSYTPTWPLDPNAPVIDDKDEWDWQDEV